MNKRVTILLIMLAFFNFTNAQDYKFLQEKFIEAEYFFITEEYSDAVINYLQIYSELPENANIAYRIGACYINIQGKENLAVRYLEAASRNMSARYKEGSVRQLAAPYIALYELARAYRINFNFEKAKEAFLQYKTILLP
jgi:tetratricopeptide (TPR) repeat protein